MTDQQIAWAQSHDWYAGYTNSGATIAVLERSVHLETKEVREEILEFSDFKKLRAWAGY